MSHKYIEDLDKAYISEYDLFLQAFDREHAQKSTSQQKEINKHCTIAQQRDNVSNMSASDI